MSMRVAMVKRRLLRQEGRMRSTRGVDLVGLGFLSESCGGMLMIWNAGCASI